MESLLTASFAKGMCAHSRSSLSLFLTSQDLRYHPTTATRPFISQATPTSQIALKIDLDDDKTAAMAAMVQRAKIRASCLQRSQAFGNSLLLDDVQSVDDISLDTIEQTWGPLLSKLAAFSNIADSVAEVPLSRGLRKVVMADSCVLD